MSRYTGKHLPLKKCAYCGKPTKTKYCDNRCEYKYRVYKFKACTPPEMWLQCATCGEFFPYWDKLHGSNRRIKSTALDFCSRSCGSRYREKGHNGKKLRKKYTVRIQENDTEVGKRREHCFRPVAFGLDRCDHYDNCKFTFKDCDKRGNYINKREAVSNNIVSNLGTNCKVSEPNKGHKPFY